MTPLSKVDVTLRRVSGVLGGSDVGGVDERSRGRSAASVVRRKIGTAACIGRVRSAVIAPSAGIPPYVILNPGTGFNIITPNYGSAGSMAYYIVNY